MHETPSPSWLERLSVGIQYCLPQHGLTAVAHRVSQSRAGWLADPLKRAFCARFPVNLDESAQPLEEFDHFNAFFTRALKPGLRRFPTDPDALGCPCDGTLSQIGTIADGHMLQAKGHPFTAEAIIGNQDLAAPFQRGRFATIYLAPYDYHRVHLPCRAHLSHEIRIPGRLFSVSDKTSRVIPGLYARNERMVALFDTTWGPMAVIMVAAMLVAGIETSWAPNHAPRPGKTLAITPFVPKIAMKSGQEMGRFHWGSTVVLLTGADAPPWLETLAAGQVMRLGQTLT
ncbi:MAG: archaetidylserine decarboxylase [Pseudomonadota bacterium]